MELPELYLRELDALLAPLASDVGTVPLKDAERTVGKAGRVSHIVPEARPFTWGPLRGIHRSLQGRR